MGHLLNTSQITHPAKTFITHSKMRQWSKEWLAMISRDELVNMMKDAKQSLHLVSSLGQVSASLMWEGRLEQLQHELVRRVDSQTTEA
jgi:hypothetical protein